MALVEKIQDDTSKWDSKQSQQIHKQKILRSVKTNKTSIAFVVENPTSRLLALTLEKGVLELLAWNEQVDPRTNSWDIPLRCVMELCIWTLHKYIQEPARPKWTCSTDMLYYFLQCLQGFWIHTRMYQHLSFSQITYKSHWNHYFFSTFPVLPWFVSWELSLSISIIWSGSTLFFAIL